MKIMNRFVLPLVVLALLLGGRDAAIAQSATGQITGTLSDATGAVVPGAAVSIMNQETGLSREVTANESGDYTLPLLPVGLYSVTTQAEGFQVVRRTDIRLNVNQTLRVNFEMVIGEVTETIEVQATAAAIDTETSSVGHVVSQKQVTQLPLNGRSFLQ